MPLDIHRGCTRKEASLRPADLSIPESSHERIFCQLRGEEYPHLARLRRYYNDAEFKETTPLRDDLRKLLPRLGGDPIAASYVRKLLSVCGTASEHQEFVFAFVD